MGKPHGIIVFGANDLLKNDYFFENCSAVAEDIFYAKS